MTPSPTGLDTLPEEIIRAYLGFPQRNEMLPVALDGGVLTVWLLRERAARLADHLAFLTDTSVRTQLVPEEEFYPALERALAAWDKEHEQGPDEDDQSAEPSGQELLGWSHEDAPIVRLVNKTLHQAIAGGASDIHFEARDDAFVIRFRLDGELRDTRSLDRSLQPTIIARIKVMGEMDVAESRAPQDGRIQVRLGGRTVDIRVSTVPTLLGEKAVLRILDRSRTVLSLPELGLGGPDLDILRRHTSLPHGIILVTGPTGSGKTTTLYAALSELPRGQRNIMTVEDPVEYHLTGINQVQVNRAAGVTFASAVRSFLRQDPDIILVGEIRDMETAGAAVQASLTGHLVLSTLHTNDAATSITRLVEMGVEPFLLASSLTLVMGQRLVRLNCPDCLEQAPLTPAARSSLGSLADAIPQQMRGRGCPSCEGAGTKGRVGLFEFISIDEELRGLIIRNASTDEIKDYAATRGFRPMLEHGLELVSRGLTTVEEVLRVTRM